jgi:hypothetical protein
MAHRRPPVRRRDPQGFVRISPAQTWTASRPTPFARQVRSVIFPFSLRAQPHATTCGLPDVLSVQLTRAG